MASARDEVLERRALVGERLRALRTTAGLSQEHLAELAGLDRKLVYRTELGTTSPRLDALLALCIALKTHPGELFTTIPTPHR